MADSDNHPTHRLLILNDGGNVITRRECYGKPAVSADGLQIWFRDRQGREVCVLSGEKVTVIVEPADSGRQRAPEAQSS